MSFVLGKGKLDVKQSVMVAVLIALHLVISRFSYSSYIIQIGFGFIIIFYAGMWFGPMWAAFIAAVCDILESFLSTMSYAPEFTLSAIVGGLIYGFMMYNRKPTFLRVLITVLLVAVIVNTIMNTYWLMLLYHYPLKQLLVPRLIKEVFGTALQVVILYGLTRVKVIDREFHKTIDN